MPKLSCRILVINDEHLVLREFVKGLNAAARTLDNPLGTDGLGRDVLARTLIGSRISLLVGLSVVSVSSLLGMFFGSVAGYFGGRVDDVISRVIDVLMAM